MFPDTAHNIIQTAFRSFEAFKPGSYLLLAKVSFSSSMPQCLLWSLWVFTAWVASNNSSNLHFILIKDHVLSSSHRLFLKCKSLKCFSLRASIEFKIIWTIGNKMKLIINQRQCPENTLNKSAFLISGFVLSIASNIKKSQLTTDITC